MSKQDEKAKKRRETLARFLSGGKTGAGQQQNGQDNTADSATAGKQKERIAKLFAERTKAPGETDAEESDSSVVKH